MTPALVRFRFSRLRLSLMPQRTLVTTVTTPENCKALKQPPGEYRERYGRKFHFYVGFTMKTLWNTHRFIARPEFFLALAGGVGWLFQSGHLDRARVTAIKRDGVSAAPARGAGHPAFAGRAGVGVEADAGPAGQAFGPVGGAAGRLHSANI